MKRHKITVVLSEVQLEALLTWGDRNPVAAVEAGQDTRSAVTLLRIEAEKVLNSKDE
jgi:hypothetical protein